MCLLACLLIKDNDVAMKPLLTQAGELGLPLEK